MRLIDADALHEKISNGPGTDLQKFFAACCVAAAPEVNPYEWISVKDRLPADTDSEYYDTVIIALSTGRVVCGCYRNHDKEWWGDITDGEYSDITDLVTHWMPLPKLPETKEN